MSLTIIRKQTPIIFDIEIRECAMDMSAYLLTGFRRSEDPDDRYPRLLGQLGCTDIIAKLGVISRRDRLVVVYAVETYAEHIHGCL